MFTGLVEAQARVLSTQEEKSGIKTLQLERPEIFTDLERGHSISVNGVCLTLVNQKPSESSDMVFEIGEESLKKTTLAKIQEGDLVNLERAMKLGDRLHGHLVSGHVDEVAEVSSVELLGQDGCLILKIGSFSCPQYLLPKGSVVLNGVSLTLNESEKDFFSLCLIPETLQKTNLSRVKKGDKINLEYDFMVKSAIHASKFLTKE